MDEKRAAWETNEEGDVVCSSCGAITWWDSDTWSWVLFIYCPHCVEKMENSEEFEDAYWFV